MMNDHLWGDNPGASVQNSRTPAVVIIAGYAYGYNQGAHFLYRFIILYKTASADIRYYRIKSSSGRALRKNPLKSPKIRAFQRLVAKRNRCYSIKNLIVYINSGRISQKIRSNDTMNVMGDSYEKKSYYVRFAASWLSWRWELVPANKNRKNRLG
jgi:hypothetical protein